MAALTTLNITEKNANNSLSVTVKVNVTKEDWKRIARFHMTKTEILSLTPLRNGQEAMKMENGGMELPV